MSLTCVSARKVSVVRAVAGHREVYKVEVYARIRRAVQVDGMSIRQAAREFGLSRKTHPEDAAVFPAAGL